MTNFTRTHLQRASAILVAGCLVGAAPALALSPPSKGAKPQGAASAKFNILAPETPGGSDDTLAHNLASFLGSAKLASVTVTNLPGQGGVKGFKAFAARKGQSGQLMVMGLGTLNSLMTTSAGVTLADVTPIARLTTGYEVVVVRPNSPYKSIDDVISAYRASPGKIRFGGASKTSTGMIFMKQLLKAAGIGDPAMKWVDSSGNYQGIHALYQDELDVGVVSYAVAQEEIKKNRVRALVMSAPNRPFGVKIPTARELGYKTELTTWQGIFAPGNLSVDETNRLSVIFAALARDPKWRTLLISQKQASYFQPALSFRFFLQHEVEKLAAP